MTDTERFQGPNFPSAGPAIHAIATDFGIVPAKDGTHTDAHHRTLDAYVRYVNRVVETAYKAGADVETFSDFMGFAKWVEQGKPKDRPEPPPAYVPADHVGFIPFEKKPENQGAVATEASDVYKFGRRAHGRD